MERLSRIHHAFESFLVVFVAPRLRVNSYSQAWLDIRKIESQTEITNIKRATFGGILKSAPIAAIELFIGFGIIIVVVSVLAGNTTGSAGAFGNVTASNAFGDTGVVIAKFASTVVLIVTLKML